MGLRLFTLLYKSDRATLTPVTQLTAQSRSIKATFFFPFNVEVDLAFVKKSEVASGLLCHIQSIGETLVAHLSVSEAVRHFLSAPQIYLTQSSRHISYCQGVKMV